MISWEILKPYSQEERSMTLLPERLHHVISQFFLSLIIMACLTANAILPAQAQTEQPQKPTPTQLKKILDDFEKYTEQAREDCQVPGMAIAVVQDDKVIFAKGFGVKKVGRR
jgi:CubicO group peptidase (beta-lactamase class C family)